jgi:uncharacterized protein YdaU (DUF1376 family)
MKTMKADEQLNWMKLNVYRFMNSESVTMMTAEEVGQYCLLLFTAWQLGKDCSLPNDPKFLERVARGPVSPAVLSRFKEVAGRLVNEVQLEIWNEGKELWKVASESGKKGNEKRWGKKEESDRPPIVPQSGADREMNTDEMRWKETTASATASATASPAEQKDPPVSFFPTHLNSTATAPNPATPSQPPDPEDEFDWDVITDPQRLARIFHHLLPQENKDAAPEAWERIWSGDLESIKDDYYLVRSVIEHAARKMDKHNVRIYVRTLSFIENYPRLKAEVLKLSKSKGNSNGHAAPPPVIPLTKKEQKQSGQCEHGLKLKDCRPCYMEAAAL